MHQYKTVRYFKASRLIMEMEQARIEGIYKNQLDKMAGYDLIVIDDFGLQELDVDMGRHLYEVIDCREGRKSTVFISQFEVSEWFPLFQNDSFADATISRMTAHAYRISMHGRNMRNSS